MAWGNVQGDISMIDRSDPHQIASIIPPNNPNYPDFPNGRTFTRYQDMEYYYNKHGFWFGRRDLLRVYLEITINKKTQTLFDYWIDGNLDGTIAWPNDQVKDLVPEAIQKQVKEQIAKIIELAEGDYPLMIHLLRKV